MAITTSEYIAKLECFKQKLEQNRPLAIAALAIHELRAKRIFTDGLKTDSTQIGQYSEEPLYVNPVTRSPKKFPVAGKHGDTKFASGKPHLTRYFQRGYKGYKQTIGRNANFVNLFNFGNLKSNFENQSRVKKISNNEYQLGLDEENANKREGLTDKYGEIFPHTQGEKTKFHEVIALELKNEFSKC